MATLKYATETPYERQKNDRAPQEDEVFAKFLENCSATKTCKKTVVGVAIFGAGRAGTLHLTYLAKNPRVRIIYIVEDIEEKWHCLREQWNLQETEFLNSSNADKVYKDTRVAAVIVTSPTLTHEAIVIAALQHAKAVFCEKPIAQNIEKTQQCYAIANKVGKPLQCGYNRRFDPSFHSLRKKVHDGAIGRLQMVKTCSRDSPIPPISYLRTSGGIFHDCAIHDLDLVIWIVGEYPTRVSVAASANLPEIGAINDYDTVAIVLTFPSGTIGIIDLARNCSYGYDQRVEAFGYKGMIRVDNQRPQDGVEVSTDLCGSRRPPIHYSFPSRYRDGYNNEMEHFLNVVEGLEKLSVEEKDVLAVSKVATACDRAAKTKQTIELTWAEHELPNRH